MAEAPTGASSVEKSTDDALDPEKAKRQARMSKALGAALLKHKVDELERNMDNFTFSRDHRLYQSGDQSGISRGGRGRPGGETSRGRPRFQRGVPERSEAEDTGTARRLRKRVVDVSVLLSSLPVVKQWVRDGRYQVVIPLDAIATLDVLKKASPTLATLAREATRYLEGQFARNASSRQARLIAQSESESLPWEEVNSSFQAHIAPPIIIPEEDGPPPLPTPDDVPRHCRPAIQCALHLGVPMYVTLPLDNSFVTDDHFARASGQGLVSWGPAFGIEVKVVTAHDLDSAKVAAKEWQKRQVAEAQVERGRGRGQGRGQSERARGRILFVP